MIKWFIETNGLLNIVTDCVHRANTKEITCNLRVVEPNYLGPYIFEIHRNKENE